MMAASGMGVQDLVVFGAVGLAAGWFVWRAVARRRRRARMGAEAPMCDSCPGCQSVGVTPAQRDAHVAAGAAGADPSATAGKRVIRLTGVGPTKHG